MSCGTEWNPGLVTEGQLGASLEMQLKVIERLKYIKLSFNIFLKCMCTFVAWFTVKYLSFAIPKLAL